MEGFGLPLGFQHCEVAPGILVLLNGLEERLEVSCSEALEERQTHQRLIQRPESAIQSTCEGIGARFDLSFLIFSVDKDFRCFIFESKEIKKK